MEFWSQNWQLLSKKMEKRVIHPIIEKYHDETFRICVEKKIRNNSGFRFFFSLREKVTVDLPGKKFYSYKMKRREHFPM